MIPLPSVISPDAPLGALGLEPGELRTLEALSVFLVEDLAACTRTELAASGALAAAVIDRFEDVLRAFGMSLLVSEAVSNSTVSPPRGDRPYGARRRQQVSPIDRFDGLAFTPATMRQIERLGLTQLGDLQAMTVRELVIHFRNPQAKEIYWKLAGSGRKLRDTPRPFELWRMRLLTTDALHWPFSASTPVRELQPWLGAVVLTLQRRGLATLGDVRAAARADGLRHVWLHLDERRRILDALASHDPRHGEPDDPPGGLGGVVLTTRYSQLSERP